MRLRDEEESCPSYIDRVASMNTFEMLEIKIDRGVETAYSSDL